MVEISKKLPAGNINVLDIQCDRVFLEPELRDSRDDWFYWKFKAVFDMPGEVCFRFSRPNKIGTRGPAVSMDRGKTWEWMPGAVRSKCDFVFDCRRPGEVWFCQALPYLQSDWARFTSEFRDHPALHQSSLCRSRKGREVELLELRGGTPPLAVVLTARHHCQEMSASMVLEGVLRHIMTADDGFLRKIALYTVPFVDKDGVEDGDQGKSRIPRDHARDYDGKPIYPETAAVWKLIGEKKPFLVLDLHSPWIRGQHNETPYLVENRHAGFAAELVRFAEILEREAPACAPFYGADTVHWGTAWNTDANFTPGVGSGGGLNLATACGNLPFVRFASTIEIPFANFGDKTMTRREFLLFGDALARTILRYAETQS